MVSPIRYCDLGMAVELLHRSAYHRNFNTSFYISTHILPPYRLGQYRLYRETSGKPKALVTWALLNHQVKEELIKSDRVLRKPEWKCGEIVFFNDWISPFGDTRELAAELGRTLFKDSVGFSFMRSRNGRNRRIYYWHGRNVVPGKIGGRLCNLKC